MTELLQEVSTPILKKIEGLNFAPAGVRFARNGLDYELDGVTEEIWRRTFELMDGTRSLAALREQAPIPQESLTQMVRQLLQANVIGLPEDRRGLTGPEFYQLHAEYSRGWLDGIAAHPIWPAMTEGRVDRAVVIGFVIEKFHYIEGAYEHMALAAANADPRISADLTRHFMEEYNHGDIYLGGLSSLFPKSAVVESLPLPSTRALVNCLNELAMTDSFAYYSANEFLQKTENIGDDLDDPVEIFYRAIESHYQLPPAVCRSMRAHTDQDQKLGHANVFEEMCAKMGEISIDSANEYLRATRQIADHLEYFLDGILGHYTRCPYVPRPKASIATI
jgi:pyrroloquinoline quinone (PQQ) biosynthesis protein C